MSDAPGRILLAGWFSFEDGEATAGDLLSADVAEAWLVGAGYRVDVATSRAFGDGIRWDAADPDGYDTVVFVCGPAEGPQLHALVDRFERCRLVAVNVSVTDPATAARFDAVIARDEAGAARPDLALLPPSQQLPVVGVVLAHPQPEYDGAVHDEVAAAVTDLLRRQQCAVVDLDTRVDPRLDPLERDARSVGEVEAVVGRLDAVVTSRLHGMVLALKQGVPAVVVDPIRGGAKVARQAGALGWPAVLRADELDPARLDEAFAWCLTDGARRRARDCAAAGRAAASGLEEVFTAALAGEGAAVRGR